MQKEAKQLELMAIKELKIDYKTVETRIEALKANMKCLDDLKLKTKTGKERKISKPGIKNIIAYLDINL